MHNLELYHTKFTGISDTGLVGCEVMLGFSGEGLNDGPSITLSFDLKAELDASFRDMREQAKAAALGLIQTAAKLLEEHSSEQLHQAALDELARQEEETQNRSRGFLANAIPMQS